MGRKKRGTRKVTFCFYCMKTFTDEKSLVEHQKSKHFRCTYPPRASRCYARKASLYPGPACNKKMNAAGALYVHCNQVHKNQLDKVPNAVEGHDTFDVDVYGMQHVPESAIHEYMEMHGMGEQVQRAKKARNDQEVAARQAAMSAGPAGASAFPQAAAAQPQAMYGAVQPGMYYGGMPPQAGYQLPPQAGYQMPPGMPYQMPPGMAFQGGYQMPPGMPPQASYQMPPGMPPHGVHHPPSAYSSAQSITPQSSSSTPAPASAPVPQAAALAPSGSAPANLPSSGSTGAAAASALALPSAQSAPPATHAPPAPAASAPPAPAKNSAVQASAFGRHAVAGKDSILVYGDDVLSPEERRASLPQYGERSADETAHKLHSMDSDLQGRLAQALS